MSSICGGVISQSQFHKDPGAYMMSLVMPDKQFKKWVALKKANKLGLYPLKEKEANKLFDKYVRSAI